MTTTLPTKGPAIPVRTDASGLTTGPQAWRVYGFADEASVRAAGFNADGGGATSVYLVSAAELASGEFILSGDPVAQAVYTAPTTTAIDGLHVIDNYPVEGGLAQPVYLVGGSLT